jgi:4-amino-4-deoxy-L-arabinose transferase-like glycosyltransferase
VGRLLYLPVLRLLVAAVFADLGALILTLIAYAATSSVALLRPALFLAVTLGLLSFAALATGAVYAWMEYPQHRRVLALVMLITVATLLAHLYIINSPSASQQGVLSGAVGAQLQDSQVSVDSSLQGQVLAVYVNVTGTQAIAELQVTADGSTLQSSGFSPMPTFSSPLEPGSVAEGNWTLTVSASQLTVSYQYLSCPSSASSGASYEYGCIMDEVYYVPEAMGMLAGQHCSTAVPNCHMEHPPLSPALIAAGMALFGEFNALGWRIMPVLLGTSSILVLFGIAWKLSGSRRIACYSAVLLALDVMFFTQSSAALLDIPMIFFGLLALLVYVWNLRLWKLDRYVLAGIMLGLAGLAKETAVFMLMAVLTYNLLFGDGDGRKRLLSSVKMAIVVVIVFSAGLQVYDSLLATPAVPLFVDQVRYILSYGSNLVGPGWTYNPPGCTFGTPGCIQITPFSWVTYYNPVAYISTVVSVCTNSVNGVCQGGQYTYVALAYYGVTNFIETWTTYIWAPLVAFILYRYFRRPQTGLDRFIGKEDKLVLAQASDELKFAALALIWFLWNYIPYILLFSAGRVTYPFYFIPAIPAVAMGVSFLLTRDWFPHRIALVYVGAAFVFFFVFFPDKAFLPIWLRAAIGH